MQCGVGPGISVGIGVRHGANSKAVDYQHNDVHFIYLMIGCQGTLLWMRGFLLGFSSAMVIADSNNRVASSIRVVSFT